MGLSGTDCSEALGRVEAFIDGELSVGDVDWIREHLAECSPCFERAEFKRAVKEMVARKCGASPEAMPEGLVERIRVRIVAIDETGG